MSFGFEMILCWRTWNAHCRAVLTALVGRDFGLWGFFLPESESEASSSMVWVESMEGETSIAKRIASLRFWYC